MKTARLILPVLAGLALTVLVLFSAVRQSSAALQESAIRVGYTQSNDHRQRSDGTSASIRYVATSGSDTSGCTSPATPCRTVQYAVDQASAGDEVRVAGGLYTDTSIYGGNIQVVYITKTVAIQGGYTLTNWTVPDPYANPTTLDPLGLGDVIYITGGVTPTLSGFRISHGQPHGIKISNASAVLQNNRISDNTTSGVYLGSWPTGISNARLESNQIRDNGQGMEIYFSAAEIVSNTFDNNGTSGEGGGVFLLNSQAVIQGNYFRGNRAGSGGAVFIRESSAILSENTMISNVADLDGGAVYILMSNPLLLSNWVVSNTSTNSGGGIQAYDAVPVFRDNIIAGNQADTFGGGVSLLGSNAVLISNTIDNNVSVSAGGGMFSSGGNPQILNNRIENNRSWNAGGLALTGLDIAPTLIGNIIAANQAENDGGGIYLDGLLPGSVIANNMVSGNQAGGSGSGMHLHKSSIFLAHNSIVGNQSGGSTGIEVGGYYPSNLVFSNTILVNHTTGISVSTGSTANLEGTLWGSGAWANGQDSGGGGTILTGTVNVWGDPGFVDPDNRDYHIGSNSAAIDAGVDAGIYTDIDGEPRPVGSGFDIGADEIQYIVRYVATSGFDASDCTAPANPCRTVQYAVDQAGTGDEVRVAGGTYTDIHVRPRQDITTTGVVTQVVYISKTLSIQGGYTLTNWSIPDPTTIPTILDAGGQGRVIYITGNISPTIDGLDITGGDADSQGGLSFPYMMGEHDAGGGVYVYLAEATIRNLQVYSNTSPHYGGGLHLSYSSATIQNNLFTHNKVFSGGGGGLSAYEGNNNVVTNTFTSNWAYFQGGGIDLSFGYGYIKNNQFIENTGQFSGGAIVLYFAHADLVDNQLIENTAGNEGGGAYLYYSDAVLKGNRIEANTATSNAGGGMQVFDGNTILENNLIINNSAFQVGGIRFDGSSVQFTNNLIADNASHSNGCGILIYDSPQITFTQNTFARNRGDIGCAVLIDTQGSVSMTNNIIVSQTVGVYIAHSTVNMEGTLWGSGAWANGDDWELYQSTLTTGTVNVWGNPGFIDPENGDYHISPGSAAIDTGVDAGVYTDIDGELRPVGAGFDIGADELQALLLLTQQASTNPVASGDRLTYTLYLTNTGAVDLHAVISDVLPAQVTPSGIITWIAFLPASSGAWTQAVTVRVDPGYAGPLTNTVQLVSAEGARASAASVVTAIQPVSGLSAINDSPTALGESTAFTAAVTAGSGLTYTWDFGDGATGAGVTAMHTYSAAGVYTAAVSAGNPVSKASAQTIVNVDALISGLSAASSSPTALGSPTVLTAALESGSRAAFTWDFGDGSSGVGQVVSHTFSVVGAFTATVTADNPVSAAAAQTSVRVEEAVAGLSAAASSPTTLGQPTAFTATIASGSHVLYLWDFGDNETAVGQVVTHTYPTVGVFTATLTASNPVSLLRVQTWVTIVTPEFRLYLPFTTKHSTPLNSPKPSEESGITYQKISYPPTRTHCPFINCTIIGSHSFGVYE